jgi:hypothetical protein
MLIPNRLVWNFGFNAPISTRRSNQTAPGTGDASPPARQPDHHLQQERHRLELGVRRPGAGNRHFRPYSCTTRSPTTSKATAFWLKEERRVGLPDKLAAADSRLASARSQAKPNSARRNEGAIALRKLRFGNRVRPPVASVPLHRMRQRSDARCSTERCSHQCYRVKIT